MTHPIGCMCKECSEYSKPEWFEKKIRPFCQHEWSDVTLRCRLCGKTQEEIVNKDVAFKPEEGGK